MVSPRWKKLLRDLRSAQVRMIMMVVAIAVSIFGVATILGAYTILMREISRNYLGTNPASAFVELDRVDEGALRITLSQPDVADAQPTSWVVARAEAKPGRWMPLLLFVTKDWRELRINRFAPEAGAWPPPDGSILLEREALRLVRARIGDELVVQSPRGQRTLVPVSGTVHDPGLAPAWQEQMLYGYISPQTLAGLGEDQTLHILKVVLKGGPRSLAGIDASVGTIAERLKAQGYAVGEIRIPPPGLHPHQGQMNSVLALLLVFSLMALALSAILSATMVGGLLAQQIRQIGIMKAIGARSVQIAGLYVALILLVGLLAVVIGTPSGFAAARWLAGVVARLLNFTLYSSAIPAWVSGVMLSMGVVVPLLTALGPIRRASRTTVHKILRDYGTSQDSFGTGRLDSILGRIRMDSTLVLALRNAFRRRGRLILTLGLLAAAGGMFMTGINVKEGWKRFLADGVASRHYDLEIRLQAPQQQEELFALIGAVSGVRKVEAWNLMPTAMPRPDGLEIVRTYPDGGHGSFLLRSVPAGSAMLDPQMLRGRWLAASDSDGIVLNQLAAAFFPDAKPGDSVGLSVNGRPASFRLLGISRQIMTPAAAYVLPQAFSAATGIPAGMVDGMRIEADAHDAASITAVTGAVSRLLDARGVGVKIFIPNTLLEGASDAHIYVFIYSLIFMAVVMAVVGALGLMSAMGTSVIERTREFGVMRAIGATSPVIVGNVVSEGVFIGLFSFVIAIAVSIIPTLVADALVGGLFSRLPLTFVVSPGSLWIWLLVVTLGALTASVLPARQAIRLTVRQTLSYV